MSTQRIAITGVDGTGKTTLVRRLAARFREHPGQVRAFRAPQYHEDPDLPFQRLSASIDALSEAADREDQPLLKATALFLSMTLYGDVERHAVAAYRPRLLFAERQCLADSLAYSRFYLPFLKAPLDRARLEPLIQGVLSPEDWKSLQGWVEIFQEREPQATGKARAGLWELPLFLRDLFSTQPIELLARLQALYHAEIPDRVILLTISPEALAARLAAKRGGAAPRELHEQSHVLMALQKALGDSLEILAKARPDLQVQALDSSGQSVEQTIEALLGSLGAQSIGS